jgi:hypothetical protein
MPVALTIFGKTKNDRSNDHEYQTIRRKALSESEVYNVKYFDQIIGVHEFSGMSIAAPAASGWSG